MKNGRMRTINMTMCALFAALIAVGAFIKIPVPYVPFTLQTFFVMLGGMLLGPRLGALSALIYLVLGLAGLPVFTEGGGIGYLLKPSFGYIIGFVIGAYITGLIASKSSRPSYLRLAASGFAGLAVIYTVGVIYVYLIKTLYFGSGIGLWNLLLYCFIIFVPGDTALCLLSALISKRLLPYIKSRFASHPEKAEK